MLRWFDVGKKRKLRKLMRRREAAEAPALVICVGKACAQRELSRALVGHVRAHAAERSLPVRVEVVGCLHVCEDGPVVATFPDIRFHRHVDGHEGCALVDKLAPASE